MELITKDSPSLRKVVLEFLKVEHETPFYVFPALGGNWIVRDYPGAPQLKPEVIIHPRKKNPETE